MQRCMYKNVLEDVAGGPVVKNPASSAGDMGSIPGQEDRSPGEGNGNPFQYSCLENSMDRGALQAIVHGISKSQTRICMQPDHHHINRRKNWKILIVELNNRVLNNQHESHKLSFIMGKMTTAWETST